MTEQIVAMLIAERDRLNRAIEALQGAVNRRGRPPKNAFAASAASSSQRQAKARGWTAAQKKAQADRMKAYWAKRRGK